MTEITGESLDELQQVDESAAFSILAVPVSVTGPVNTHELPSRLGVVTDFGLTQEWQMILGEDLKRKRLTIISDKDWQLSHAPHGGGRWPANIPLVVMHAGPIYGRCVDPVIDAVLCVIPEEWAD